MATEKSVIHPGLEKTGVGAGFNAGLFVPDGEQIFKGEHTVFVYNESKPDTVCAVIMFVDSIHDDGVTPRAEVVEHAGLDLSGSSARSLYNGVRINLRNTEDGFVITRTDDDLNVEAENVSGDTYAFRVVSTYAKEDGTGGSGGGGGGEVHQQDITGIGGSRIAQRAAYLDTGTGNITTAGISGGRLIGITLDNPDTIQTSGFTVVEEFMIAGKTILDKVYATDATGVLVYSSTDLGAGFTLVGLVTHTDRFLIDLTLQEGP